MRGRIGAVQEVRHARKDPARDRAHPARGERGREHFVLEFAVCPAPESVRVDAWMPEHRHGMNYRPTVARLGDGRYRAEGLMLHMAGRWELVFDVRSGDSVERLTQSIRLE
jgi:YtkA-like protein